MSAKTIPPLTLLLYCQTGVWRKYLHAFLFFFSFQNIDCGYLLDPPLRVCSNVYPVIYIMSKINQNIKLFPMKFSIFMALKKISCLYWGFTSQSKIFQSCRDGFNKNCRYLMCLSQGHNAVPPVGIIPLNSDSHALPLRHHAP